MSAALLCRSHIPPGSLRPERRLPLRQELRKQGRPASSVLRAMALLRADEAPEYKPVPERAELPHDERDRLRDKFLSSPEGEQFPSDSDEAYAASLAIDFCADYVDGRPLRWSPVVVELFIAGWIPRKVLADQRLLDRLPAALDAWVRFAGRKSGTPEWAVKATVNAIPRWPDVMIQRGNDPSAGGPAKQFLTAAKAAGVNLEDRDALRRSCSSTWRTSRRPKRPRTASPGPVGCRRRARR